MVDTIRHLHLTLPELIAVEAFTYVGDRERRIAPPHFCRKIGELLVDMDAEEHTGPVWAQEKDSRRTKAGSFMRKMSFDELPQLLNIIRGNMSLIGPRPERAFFVEQFKNDILGYMSRHRIKPGITGWAQVNGLRGNTSIAERTKYDLYYIENWSIAFDLKILLRTILEFCFHKHAY